MFRNLKTCRRSFLSVCVLGALLFVMSAPGAYADLILTLNVGNAAIAACCGSGPFGTVDLAQTTSSLVTATVTLNNPYLFVDTGGAGAFTFNIANIVFSNLTFVVNPASVAAGFSSTVSGNGTFNQHEDGFGFFDYAIQGDANHTSGGSTPIGQLLTFTIPTKDASNLPLSDFQLNSTGGGTASFIAADIIRPASGNLSAVTGFVGSDPGGGPPQSVVPEPSTMGLLGTVLVGLGWAVRKKLHS